MTTPTVPLFLLAFTLASLAVYVYFKMRLQLVPSAVLCIVLVVVLAAGLVVSCVQTPRPHEETFANNTSLMPESGWLEHIRKHTSPEDYTVRNATTQPTPSTTKLLIQHADSEAVMLPTNMTSNQLSYVLRVWVTATNRSTLQRTNPVHIRYNPSNSTDVHDVPIQYRIVEEQQVPYDGIVGARWFLVESSAFQIPPSATNVHWQLNATLTETHWCTFDVQYKRPSHDFHPIDGLQALYSTFLDGSVLHHKRWHDESGYNAVTSFADTPTLADNGIVLESQWNGPSSSLLVSNNDCQNTDNNIVNFTLSFYYKTPPSTQASTPPGTHSSQSDDVVEAFGNSTERFTLFTVFGKYRNQKQFDNPPNYFIRCEVDTANSRLYFIQQQVPDTNTGVYAKKQFYVPLQNHSNDPVLYTMVVQSSTRAEGNIDVYINKKHETTHTKWLDLNYSLQTTDHITWGASAAHSSSSSSGFPPSYANHGSLYMLALFNRGLSKDDVRKLSQYVLHKYNAPTPTRSSLAKQKTYEYYVPREFRSPQNNSSTSTQQPYDDDDSKCGNEKESAVACVKYKPQSSDSSMTCSYVASDAVNEQCVKGLNVDDNFYYYPVTNQSCQDAMQMLTVVQQDAQDIGMEWKYDTVEGFTYRSQLSDDAYNKLTPQQKMNVLNDQTFLRTYRKI